MTNSNRFLFVLIFILTSILFNSLWSSIGYSSYEIFSSNKSALKLHGDLKTSKSGVNDKVRRILWWTTTWGHNAGFLGYGGGSGLKYLQKMCKFKCEFTANKALVRESHAILFWAWATDLRIETVTVNGTNVTRPKNPPPHRDENQYYVYVTTESPIRMKTNLEPYRNFFNWTMVYRLDADFPLTFGRFVRKSPKDIKSYIPPSNLLDHFANRSKLVAWIVSNCRDIPSERGKVVTELQKHIPIDIYGKCGNKTCPKRKDCYKELGKYYKFYLSFENSLCRDYVTEKYFRALDAHMVPIVYGKANYGNQFAPGSYIDVDTFASAKSLADYLKYLDDNDEQYLKYFRWRKYYRSKNSYRLQKLYCQMCERLHKEYGLSHSYLDIVDWLFKNNSESPICSHPTDEFYQESLL